MKTHYKKDELEQFLDNKMFFLKEILCRRHLKKCQECRHLVGQIKEDSQLITEIKKIST